MGKTRKIGKTKSSRQSGGPASAGRGGGPGAKKKSRAPKAERNAARLAAQQQGGGGGKSPNPNKKKTPNNNPKNHANRSSNEDAAHAGPSKAGQAQAAETLYHPSDRVLVVGDGDLSFSLALATMGTASGGVEPWNLEATVFDTLEVARGKYPGLDDNAASLMALGAKVAFNVDATDLQRYLNGSQGNKGTSRASDVDGETYWLDPPYDAISFHFPHLGEGVKDEERSVISHGRLVASFLMSAKSLVTAKEGRIHVSIKRGPRYDKWRVAKSGTSPEIGLRLRNVLPFEPSAWRGYRHRRTIGYAEGISAEENEDVSVAGARTFIFDNGGLGKGGDASDSD